VIAFFVIVGQVFGQCFPGRLPAKQDQTGQCLCFYSQNPSFAVCVQIRRPERQSEHFRP
jgi:hypothetical protein